MLRKAIEIYHLALSLSYFGLADGTGFEPVCRIKDGMTATQTHHLLCLSQRLPYQAHTTTLCTVIPPSVHLLVFPSCHRLHLFGYRKLAKSLMLGRYIHLVHLYRVLLLKNARKDRSQDRIRTCVHTRAYVELNHPTFRRVYRFAT